MIGFFLSLLSSKHQKFSLRIGCCYVIFKAPQYWTTGQYTCGIDRSPENLLDSLFFNVFHDFYPLFLFWGWGRLGIFVVVLFDGSLIQVLCEVLFCKYVCRWSQMSNMNWLLSPLHAMLIYVVLIVCKDLISFLDLYNLFFILLYSLSSVLLVSLGQISEILSMKQQ